MSFALRIIDEEPGQPRRQAVSLRLVSERVTAGEIIRRRVEAEVAAYNAAQNGVFSGLVQPSDSVAERGGFRVRPGRALDAGEQVNIALAAFGQNRILMLFDDRQVDRVDDVMTIGPESTVTFIRLVPLVGG